MKREGGLFGRFKLLVGSGVGDDVDASQISRMCESFPLSQWTVILKNISTNNNNNQNGNNCTLCKEQIHSITYKTPSFLTFKFLCWFRMLKCFVGFFLLAPTNAWKKIYVLKRKYTTIIKICSTKPVFISVFFVSRYCGFYKFAKRTPNANYKKKISK